MKDYKVKTNGQNFFDQPVDNIRTYKNIQKVTSGQRNDYTSKYSESIVNALYEFYLVLTEISDYYSEEVKLMFPHKIQQVLMKLIFPITYYWLIGKLRIFARLSQIIHQKHKIIKESDVQNNKIGGFLNRTFGKLIHVVLPLRKNILMSLVKSVLIGLGWTATISATDAGILGCGTTILTILNLKDIKKIVKSLEDAGVLIKNVSQTI